MTPGTLYVVSTPIGNLEDVSLRALRVLGEVRVVLCEDTRRTRKLLARHGVTARLVSCHEHNEAARAREAADRLAAGEDLALVTDAGTPLVSDPGARVIAAAIQAGAQVVPVPGASAALAALAASGIAGGRFTFFGFPPRRGRERRAFLDEVLGAAGAAVLFESPHRVQATLAELAAGAPDRPASLHREITKVHEETLRGTLGELARVTAGRPARGEYTLVVAGSAPAVAVGSLTRAVSRGLELVEAGQSRRDASRLAAAAEGVSPRAVYRGLLRHASDEEE